MSGVDQPLYELDATSFAVAGRAILAPLTLQLSQHRIVGLIGSNGSGKSTLVKIMARQQKASSGSISLFGKALSEHTDREFARLVAYMPQFTPPAESLTVRELVSLGRFPWHGALGRFSDDDTAKVDQALLHTDLTSYAERLVESLSGGERQRAWLGMMLAQDARCLLLDEPTSALDIAHQVEMLALVQRLSRERGLGVVVVLHDINMAARYCDEIVALRGGQMIARGTPAEILDGDVLDRIYGLPMGILPHPATGVPISYVR